VPQVRVGSPLSRRRGRALTPAEREEAQDKVARFEDLQAKQQARAELTLAMITTAMG
jgi:hypothetical protein